jgi:hypothetical protein
VGTEDISTSGLSLLLVVHRLEEESTSILIPPGWYQNTSSSSLTAVHHLGKQQVFLDVIEFKHSGIGRRSPTMSEGL